MGSIGDIFGRRPTLLLGLVLNSIAGFSAALTPNVVFLCFCRFISGLGIGSILSSLVPLAAETSPPSKRGFYITAVSSSWTVGSMFVAVLGLFMFGSGKDELEQNWRIFIALCALPCFIGGVMVYLYVPESPRYLALQHRYEDAANVANHVARSMGYTGVSLGSNEVEKQFNPSLAYTGGGSSYPSSRSKVKRCCSMEYIKHQTRIAMRNIFQLYSTNNNSGSEFQLRDATLYLQCIWFALSFGSGLNTWMNTIFKEVLGVDDIYLHALFYSLANIPGVIAAGIFMDRIGRKPLLVSSMALSSLCLYLFAYLLSPYSIRVLSKPAIDFGVIICACFFHAFLVVSWCAVNVITTEVFPTKVRTLGLGLCASFARFGAMLCQYVNGSYMQNDDPMYLLVITSSTLLFGAVLAFLKIGKDKTQEDLSDFINQRPNMSSIDYPMERSGDRRSGDPHVELV
eukprot:CAMPEP_0178950880 /NCGR_PEP_ID=MMETSP0789-20121207/6899_1 /TAXON_ID=3005 /ORGANISM="Rhizosolenia setigera, Strain CCMP 1694" /LENGTH=455 /DNA_ID=CAMNT_0020631657 /DNA_START=469 /DNA_END=1836 /DNA_ORIENTATION=+